VGDALCADGSHAVVDRTSLNLSSTQGDHQRSSSDILLRFETQATQRQVVSKLKFEYRTKWGAVGYRPNRKWILTTAQPP